jgi:parallel beta-helix repeat protein
MIEKKSQKRRLCFVWLAAAMVFVFFTVAVPAQAELNDPLVPGTVEGTGTYFEVTDSDYLNITLESSEPVTLILESVPEMIMMHLEASDAATSTQITLSGLEPSTTYYKYEDDYHNLETLTTDGNGSCSYVQDLSVPHLVFIQPNASTIYIPGDTSVGTWDSLTRTYTLTTDVYETIQIDEDNMTLDGAGHTVTGPDTSTSGYGVYLNTRTSVTIKNINVQGFSWGLVLNNSSNNILTDNTSSYNPGLGGGILVSSSNGNTLTGNIASNNGSGIRIGIFSNNNTLTGNTSSNNNYGISINSSNGNILAGNTFDSCSRYGIKVTGSNDNQIYNNNFIGTPSYYQAYVDEESSGNVFNLPKPIGGNHWSDWTSPDADGDGFVDLPYVFDGGQDNLPRVNPDGWIKPVIIDIKPGSEDGDDNTISLGAQGLIPVAIFTEVDDGGQILFDATTVDAETVELAGMGVAIQGKSNDLMAYAQDVDEDGFDDFVVHVATANFDPEAVQEGMALLTGTTYGGMSIGGSDEITIVPIGE